MRRLLLLAVTAMAPAFLDAQAAPDGTPAPFITHASCVDSTRSLLGAFQGDYRVHTLNRAGPAAWDSTDARAHFAWELDGCLMVERYEGQRGGEPYSTLALWGTSGNPERPIQRTFAHSQHGVLVLSEGRWNAAGDTLTLADSAFVRGVWVQQRYVVSRPRSGVFTAEGRRSEDHGATWIVTMRARYNRI
jgi:hypothetical protein